MLIDFNSLKFLERENYIAVSDAVYTPGRLKMTASNEILYQFEVANPRYENFIKSVLRMYAGLFDGAETASLPIAAGRLAYIHIARGAATVNGVALKNGDALKLSDVTTVDISAGQDAEVLVFDLAP